MCKKCCNCIYFRSKRYELIDGSYIHDCSRCSSTSDYFDKFDNTVYVGTKVCFAENLQQKMF